MNGKRTITVVDDNPDIVTIVKTILEGKGYEVVCASSGQELFNGLGDHKPDLVILDIMMPQMDGLEVLTRLKGTTETASIPVILLTAKVQYEDVMGGYKLGPTTTLPSHLPARSCSTGSSFSWKKKHPSPPPRLRGLLHKTPVGKKR